MLTLLYDSLNLVVTAFSSGLLGAWFTRKDVRALPQLDCVARTMHQSSVYSSEFPISQSNAEPLIDEVVGKQSIV